jgi:hypothetical protein
MLLTFSKLQNRSDQVRTINAVLSATAHYYNGVKAGEAKRATGFFILQPNARESHFHFHEEKCLLPSTCRNRFGRLGVK